MSYIRQNQCPSRLGEVDIERPFSKSQEEVLRKARKDIKNTKVIDFAFNPLKGTAKLLLRGLYDFPSEEEKIVAIIEKTLIRHGLI
jgi:hypothetical protein